MLDQILRRIYRFRCPDEHQLAAYADQQLIGEERKRVETHLAKCSSCLQQVGYLVRNADGAVAPVPARLLRAAQQLQPAPPRNSLIAWQWAGVAAAIAVVAIAAILWRSARPDGPEEHPAVVATAQQPQPPGIAPNPEAETAVRSKSSHISPVVLSPQPGAIVHVSDFIIRWEPIERATAYEVRVVTADGDLVWRKRVQETSAKPPSQIVRPGAKYFVWLRALLPGGKTQQSAAVSFVGG